MQIGSMDIIIVIGVIISTVIAFNRGFVKEVLAILGWILATFCVMFLLPIFKPAVSGFIDNPAMTGAFAAFFIFIGFFIIWIYGSSKVVSSVRSSQLSSMDRMLGLGFGLLRAFLIVVIANVVVSWIVPRGGEAAILRDSGLFQYAGRYSGYIEDMVPQSALDAVSAGGYVISGESDNASNDMFDQLAQPKVEAKGKKRNLILDAYNYDDRQQKAMDRMINMVQ